MTDSNILVDLLKQGSFAVVLFFVMFLTIKTLWKKQETEQKDNKDEQRKYFDKIVSIIETSTQNTKCIEKNNELLTEMLAKQENYSNQMTIALNEFSNQLNNCAFANSNINNGATKPKKIKNYTLK